MEIAVLDFSCNSIDTIFVEEEFIDKHYDGDVESFLYGWCGYSSSIQYICGDVLMENFNMNLNSFSGNDEELDIDDGEVEESVKKCKYKKDIDDIMDIYKTSDVCMAETLADIPANGLTLEEAFELYVQAMKKVDGDEFYKVADGETIKL